MLLDTDNTWLFPTLRCYPIRFSVYNIGQYMSIFSGFATRKQEERYNHYIVSLINLLQDKIVELMSFCRCSQDVIY